MRVAYLRVSTEGQTEKYGLAIQRQKILDYCEKNDIKIDKWYVDGGYSGSKLDRPDIQRLLDDAENGLISTVYIYKLDRLSRDTADTLELMYRILPKFGVKVISMTEEIRTDNPMDRVMLTVNAAMNQYEREIIRMRMADGMVERVKKGLWMGGGRIPYGYYYDRNDGILHINNEQAEQVRNAYKLYLEGYSCDRISHILGFKGERIVTQILKRKSNIGLIEYKGEVYKGLHEPVVDEETFYRTQELMKKRSTNSHIANDHILTGLCRCGVCGARMRYHKWSGSHRLICYSQVKGKEYMQHDPNCNNARVIAKDVEREVEESFKQFAINIQKTEKSEEIDNVVIINDLIKKSNIKIKKMYSLYIENDSENLLSLIREEEKKVRELKAKLKEEDVHKMASKVDVDEVKRVADVWDCLTGKEKNKVLKECIDKIIITNGEIEIYFVTI